MGSAAIFRLRPESSCIWEDNPWSASSLAAFISVGPTGRVFRYTASGGLLRPAGPPRLFFFLLILFLSLTTVPGLSQSGPPAPYYFPGANVNTDVVIANINTQSVTVTVAFYQTTGELNSTTILLEPGKQTRLNPTSVGLTTFSGTIVVTSGLPMAVSASVFPGDNSLDFVYPSQPATELLIPFAPLDSASIDVNLFNPGIEQAQVTVVMLKDDGNIQTSSTTTLDPSHSTTMSLTTTANTTHLFIRTTSLFTGDRPVAANAVIRSYSPSASGAVLRTDFAAVTALPISNASTTTALPYFATGSDYFTIVEVTNLTNSSQTVSITAKALDGTNVPGTNNPASVTIPAFGSTRQVVSSLFNLSGTGLTTGSITVGGTGPLYAAAAIGNVFAVDDDTRVALHLFVQAAVDKVDHRARIAR